MKYQINKLLLIKPLMHLGKTALDEALGARGINRITKLLRANGELLLNFLHFIKKILSLALSVIFIPVHT